jgi:hypothetical protein
MSSKPLHLFPWQHAAWQQFCAWRQALSPLLLLEAQGLGETTLVRYLAMTWQCFSPQADGAPCQQCAACQQVLAGSEAMTMINTADEDEKSLGVDWVRQTTVRLQQKAERKFLAIVAAERLTVAAANALLKFLEEPPPNTVIILSSAQPSRLLPTVRSRLRPWRLPRPSFRESLAWLQHTYPNASALELNFGLWLSGGALLVEPPPPKQAADFFIFLETCGKGSQEHWPLHRWQSALQAFGEESVLNFSWRLLALVLLQLEAKDHQAQTEFFDDFQKLFQALLPLLQKTAWPQLSVAFAQKPVPKLLAFQDFLLHLAALRQQNVQKDLWWVNVALPFFELFNEEAV